LVALADIRAAAGRLQGHVLDTPCVESLTLGQITGCRVFLKFENLQFTASFKECGALYKLATLRAAGEWPRSVIAGQGTAHPKGASIMAEGAPWGSRGG
jgi:threonine dehydratase